ncbi:Transcription factor Tfb2 family protein [Babesia bovis T2Bo]|uniref:General transcription factor IIH subunit 4 n=1 Tax=Babesia bovis TaxID=5865 RepID=A7ARI7_BABBO|nr:Transcription factor Tfb2 family protein [Babesia bovis T2Bo]EDO07156.1 Transcription factor Tfb2 family protein [Babesia bovis T2Bo]|eukprot:XP_001610724.1 hypothetical protein [Babesia bovis T2Bo]
MEDSFLNHIRLLGDKVWHSLFRRRAPNRAIFRSLGELEQLIILRLVNINQAVPERALRLWMNPTSFTDFRRALSLLRSYYIVEISDNRAKDGKQQYELNQYFKESTLKDIYDIPLELEQGFYYLGNVEDRDKIIGNPPSINTLIQHSKERLDFLVLFLVSKEHREKTLRANKILKKIRKLEKMKGTNTKNPLLFKKVKSLEQQLFTLTKNGKTISSDLLHVLEGYSMIFDEKKKNRIGRGESLMSRHALSWLLKGVDTQLIILIVGYLKYIEKGYLFNETNLTDNSEGRNEARTDVNDQETIEKLALGTNYLTESLDLLLSLSQARYGDTFRLDNPTLSQQRILRFLIELGLVYADSDGSKIYVTNLSFLVDVKHANLVEEHQISMSVCGNKGSKMVVQSNFKIYAYIPSALQMNVLNHICELQAKTPNLVIGVLTRSSLQTAFKSGITADQLICFFESKGQYDDIQINRNVMNVPENVRRQLKMWEAERNRLELLNAVVFKRWDNDFIPELFKRVVRWAQTKRYEIYHTAWPSDISSSAYQKWLENEKYLGCTLESKEEVIEKIKQIRSSLAEEKIRSSSANPYR